MLPSQYTFYGTLLSERTAPHFTTIAEFISGLCDAIELLFEQVLLVYDEQGLLGNELFAIDGCKAVFVLMGKP